MDKEILKELGLTNNEVEVYLVLLQQGSISVNEVAERAGLHRQAVYDALDRLLEKGFVSFVMRGGKKHFQGVQPERVIDFLKEKEEKFRTILPELVNLTKLPREDTFVEVFKGKSAVKSLYRGVIKEFEKGAKEVLIAGVNERDFVEEDRLALAQYLRAVQRFKSKERVLVNEGETYFVEGPQTAYRWIPKENFSPTPMFVYGDKWAVLIWGNPSYLVVIENKNLAEAYRRQFNLLWQISKKIEKAPSKSA